MRQARENNTIISQTENAQDQQLGTFAVFVKRYQNQFSCKFLVNSQIKRIYVLYTEYLKQLLNVKFVYSIGTAQYNTVIHTNYLMTCSSPVRKDTNLFQKHNFVSCYLTPRFGILELQKRDTQNDVTLRVTNSIIFVIPLSS